MAVLRVAMAVLLIAGAATAAPAGAQSAGLQSAGPAEATATGESPATRVAWLARRLLVANADQCLRQRWDFGLAAQRDRLPGAAGSALATAVSAEPEGFRVVQLVPGSPAVRGGLQLKDQLIAANGQDWTSTGFALAFARADWAQAGAEQIELKIVRAGSTLTIPINAERACAIPVRLVPEMQLNASAAAGVAFINTGLEHAIPQDDQLATVMAHEIAHVILGHRKLGAGSNDRAQMERDADALGVRLALRAGFDPHAAARAIEMIASRMGNTDARKLGLNGDHLPTPARRRFLQEQAIEARREQLASQSGGQAVGQP